MEELGDVQDGARIIAGTGTHAHCRQVGAAQVCQQGLLCQVSFFLCIPTSEEIKMITSSLYQIIFHVTCMLQIDNRVICVHTSKHTHDFKIFAACHNHCHNL